jgi:hypothetical protein
MAGGVANNQPSGYDARNPHYAGQYANMPEYGTPNSAYAAPDIRRDAPYNDEFGWSAKTRISVESTPDAMREFAAPVRDMRPPAGDSPNPYYRTRDAEEQRRESVTDQDANGWVEKKDRYKVGPDPRWNPPAETRMTEQMSPRSYSFTRPFDQGTKGNGARQLNGLHFSMADHRREYDILGIRPWSQHRNTYRADPAPWDADMYDVPPQSTMGAVTNGRIQAVEIPNDYGNRSYRL